MMIPENGSFWMQNKSSEMYQVITVSNLNATRDGRVRTVVYKDQYQNVWSRPLEEWNEKYIQ